MKFPKHRANIFLVQRSPLEFNSGSYSTVVVGVFPTTDGAEAFKGACEQEMVDRGMAGLFSFDVALSTFYDT